MHDMYIQFLNGVFISGRSDTEQSVISNQNILIIKNSKLNFKKYLKVKKIK